MAGKMRNCQRCGKLFMQQNREKICRDCRDAEVEMENKVMDFVRSNPECKVPDIVEGTGAEESLVVRMIEEGRFEQTNLKSYHPCKKCGKEILTGQYCEACLSSMQENLQSVHARIATSSAAAAAAKGKGMHSKNLGKTGKK